MTELFPFFIVLFAGLIFAGLFSRLHVPWVVALIVGGIAIGPHGFHIFAGNDTLEFLGQIGLVFLMFMAGLETKLSEIKKTSKKITIFALLNGLIPFAVGFGIGYIFDFSLLASLLLGVIFISSSVAVIIPSLEAAKLIESRVGRIIVAGAVFEDIVSLVLLSIVLQSVDPITVLPLPALYILLAVMLVLLKWAIPHIEKFVVKNSSSTEIFRVETRTIFVILLGTVVIFEILGLHPIVAGFFAGVVLSDTIQSPIVKERLRTLSYGIFIPVFFVLIGTKADLSVFGQLSGAFVLIVTIIVGSIGSKFVSGWLGARLSGFTNKYGYLAGSATIPSLSTTLAVAFSGVELGILSTNVITAMILLSLVSTMVSPLLVRHASSRLGS